jgi:hypothetical protein
MIAQKVSRNKLWLSCPTLPALARTSDPQSVAELVETRLEAQELIERAAK